MNALLVRLAYADRRGGEFPAEGFSSAIEMLEAFAERKRADLGTATLRMHQRFFPMLGTHRAAATARAMKTGTFVAPPPMHPFFAAALELAVVNDREGPQKARAHFKTADHAVGLSRCLLAGALDTSASEAFGLGSSMASVTHADREATGLGGFLGMVAHFFLRGADFAKALDAATAVARLGVTPARAIAEAAAMAEMNALAPREIEFLPCAEVARVMGCFARGRMDPSLLRTPPFAVIEPIVFPLIARIEVTIPGARIRRIEEAVAAAVAAKIIPAA